MTETFDVALALLGVPVLVATGYLFCLTVLSARLPVPSYGSPKRTFRIVVPAHDEEAGIAATVENLLAIDYPRDLFEVWVVADNCRDGTAARARDAGAVVIERVDAERRGKGYALLYAFERLPDQVDAAVVIDADTVVSKNLLRAFAARLDAGARAVQADYAVRNPNAAWRTRLIAIAFGAFHIVRSRARERLGVSAGLRGNGMCFSTEVLRAVPHEAFSIVEDVEYGIRLAEAGYRVFYADEAHVYGEMVSTAGAAKSQRNRWEGGRKALFRTYGRRLAEAALSKRDPMLFDLFMDVAVPPLSRIAVSAAGGFAVAAAGRLSVGGFGASSTVYGASVVALIAYVLRGWAVSGTGLRGLVDLGLAPVYVVWKIGLKLAPAPRTPDAPEEWIRTRRESGDRELEGD